MTLPNLITIFRFLLVPVVIYALLHGAMATALIVFIIAGASDAIDGIIARFFDQQTTLGAWLDPLADKALLVSVFISLAIIGTLPDWFVFIAVSRDALIMGAVAISSLVGDPLEVKPLFISKATTLAQIVLASLFLAVEAFGLFPANFLLVAVWFTAGLTIASGASYLHVWMQHMKQS